LKTRYNHDDENLSDEALKFDNKFIIKTEAVFSSLPKPVDWLSFYQAAHFPSCANWVNPLSVMDWFSPLRFVPKKTVLS